MCYHQRICQNYWEPKKWDSLVPRQNEYTFLVWSSYIHGVNTCQYHLNDPPIAPEIPRKGKFRGSFWQTKHWARGQSGFVGQSLLLGWSPAISGVHPSIMGIKPTPSQDPKVGPAKKKCFFSGDCEPPATSASLSSYHRSPNDTRQWSEPQDLCHRPGCRRMWWSGVLASAQREGGRDPTACCARWRFDRGLRVFLFCLFFCV